MQLTYAQPGGSKPKPPTTKPADALDIDPTLKQQLMSVGIGGFTRAGNALDLIPSMLRDTLSLRNPFDQILDPFGSSNRVTGREMLEDVGLVGANKSGLDAGDAAGFGLEVVLNPFSLLGVGFGTAAMTAGGRAAKGAGLLSDAADGFRRGTQAKMRTSLRDVATTGDAQRKAADAAAGLGKTFEEVADEPLQGLMSYKVPFTERKVIGTGERAQKIAGKIDNARDWLGDTRVATAGRTLFDGRVRNAKTRPVQDAFRRMSDRLKSRDAERRAWLQGVANTVREAGFDGADSAGGLRQFFESDLGKVPGYEALGDTYTGVRDRLDGILTKAEAQGRTSERLLDFEIDQYFPRYRSDVREGVRGGQSATFDVSDPSSNMRLDFLRDIGDGTEGIRRVLMDPEVRDLAKTGSVDEVKELLSSKYYTLFPDAQDGDELVRKFAKWTVNRSDEELDVGFFGNSPLVDLDSRIAKADFAELSADAAYDALGDIQSLGKMLQNDPDAGAETVESLLGRLGLDAEKGAEHIRAAATRLGNTVPDEIDVRRLGIPQEVADELVRLSRPAGRQDVNPLLQAADSVTNLFKAGVTSPWPAFHVRNLLSGAIQNATHGHFDPGSFRDAWAITRGRSPASLLSVPAIREAVENAGKELTPENAADAFRELAAAQGISQTSNTIIGDVVGGTRSSDFQSADRFFDDLPGGLGGASPFDFGDMGKAFAGRTDGATINPLKASYRGVGKADETTFGPGVAGEMAGNEVENLNRLVPFLNQLRKGVTADEAARNVRRIQVDYNTSAYSDFENSVMKRLMPFYAFNRGAAPTTFQHMLENPGNPLHEGIRLAGRLRENSGEIVPEYVANTAAIPLPSGDEGDPRYLTGFGIMQEGPLEYLAPPQDFGLELLSASNPLIKAPLEYAFGESTFQRGPGGGRDLESMDPPIGRTISNVAGWEKPVDLPDMLEHAVANSPLARAVTSARTLTDPRKDLGAKAANLLSGVRVTDVPEKARDYAVRQKAVDALRDLGGREFNTLYVPEEKMADLSPDQQEFVRTLLGLRNMIDQRNRARKAAGE